MKPTVKILLFCFAMALISGCCSQKCAERRLQRIVKNHPELIDVKLRTLDTFLSVPGFSDMTVIPFSAIANGETICEATDHGKFVVSVNRDDSTVCVGYVADAKTLHFTDTMKYMQVIVGAKTEKHGDVSFWHRITEWISFLFIGMGLSLYLIWKLIKKVKTK